MSNDFPSGKFERGRAIAKTGLKMGTNYAKFRLKEALGKKSTREERSELNRTNAGELFKEFSKLRGTALKLAQGMSLDTAILPEEFADVLTQAQYGVPPINRVLVRNIIKKQLGGYPEEVFESFEPEATAAASLGQVHKAVAKDGRKLAVKVQYPNVRDTIESDLGMAKVIFKRIVSGEKADEYFSEVGNKLMEETDYRLEGAQIEAFRKQYADETTATPEWIEELSTGNVLTMTWLEGRHLNEFLKENPTQEERNHFGQLLWDFFHRQINDSYTVHADAHPGNYLFLDDGRLGVIDFGCVKVCPKDFFLDYMRLFVAHREGNEQKMKQLYSRLEIIEDPENYSKDDQQFYDYSLRLGRRFVSPYDYDTFDFGEADFFDAFNKLAKQATAFREPRGSRHFIFVARAHLGMYQMLMKLRAVVDIRPGREMLQAFLKSHQIADGLPTRQQQI